MTSALLLAKYEFEIVGIAMFFWYRTRHLFHIENKSLSSFALNLHYITWHKQPNDSDNASVHTILATQGGVPSLLNASPIQVALFGSELVSKKLAAPQSWFLLRWGIIREPQLLYLVSINARASWKRQEFCTFKVLFVTVSKHSYKLPARNAFFHPMTKLVEQTAGNKYKV
jgi:hypothetical protein